MNIMQMVKGAVSDQIMGQIGGVLGLKEAQKTSSVFDTALGSILGGLMKKSSTSEGAQQVFDMASKADHGIMDNLGSIFGNDSQQLEQVQQAGSGMLQGIFGGDSQINGIIQTVAKFLGMDQSIIGKLLTFAAPMLIGSMGKHVKSSGLDAMGLGNLLGEQKQHLAGVLPTGLADNLNLSGMLSGAKDLGKSALASATDAAATVGSASSAAVNQTKSGGLGLIKFLLPLLIIGAIGYLAFTMLGGLAKKTADSASDMVSKGQSAIGNAVSGLQFEGIDMSALGDSAAPLNEGFSKITDGFAGLKTSGEDGAKKLATTISDFTGSIDGLGIGNLSGAGKTAATSMFGQFAEKIQSLVESQSPAIQGILKPVVDLLIDKLKSFG